MNREECGLQLYKERRIVIPVFEVLSGLLTLVLKCILPPLPGSVMINTPIPSWRKHILSIFKALTMK